MFLKAENRVAAIITEAPRGAWGIWAAPLALAMLLLVLECFGDAGRQLLRYDREAIAAGEWWRLVSGNFVHLGWYHWMLNEIGILVLVLLCPERLAPAVWLRRLLLIGLGMTMCLFWLVPEMVWYVGLSGVMHGLFLLGLARQALQRDWIALACLAYLFGKLAWEMVMGVPVSDEVAIGGKVALESHLYGALSALVYGLVFRAFTREEQWNPWERK